MTSQHYVLSPSAWGAAEELPVDNLVQAFLFSDFAAATGTSYIAVSLQPDPLSGAWRVRYRGGVLGEVGAAERGLFPDVQAVHAAGLLPETLAGVRLDRTTGLFEATVFLPPAPLAVPRNDAPHASRVLPAGDMVPVDSSSGDYSAAEIAEASPGQWIVGLRVLDGVVVVTLGPRVLGHVPEEDSRVIGPALGGSSGGTFSARAYFLEGMVGLDLDTGASSPSAAAALPGLGARRAPHPGAVVTEFPDGTWAVSVAREEATDDVSHSQGARRVSTPQAPSVDFTPTRSWSISAGNYLTEVEKVRLRRQADGAAAEGRHRLVD